MEHPASVLPNVCFMQVKRLGAVYLEAVKDRVSLIHKYTSPVFILAHGSQQILAENYFWALCNLIWGLLPLTSVRNKPCKLTGAGITSGEIRQKIMDCKTHLLWEDFAIVVVHTHTTGINKHMFIFLHMHARIYSYICIVYICNYFYIYACICIITLNNR